MKREKLEEIIKNICQFSKTKNFEKNISKYLIEELIPYVERNTNGETSLSYDTNSLCNKLDRKMVALTKKCANSPCIIDRELNEKTDIYTQMYNINEAFKLIAEARVLVSKV